MKRMFLSWICSWVYLFLDIGDILTFTYFNLMRYGIIFSIWMSTKL